MEIGRQKNSKTKYRGVIIGAGAVAAGYDHPGSEEITTHAHAFSAHPRARLAGIQDMDRKRVYAAAKKWETTAFTDLVQMFKEVKPEIVSVCTPDETHYQILRQIIGFKPKLVIAEKPLTTDLGHTREILSLYRRARVPILVNYRRRFDPAVQLVREKIMNGEYGKVLGAGAVYGKGLLHSGSHMIDLARFLFGEAVSSRALAKRVDYISTDETVSGFLTFQKCPAFYLLAADEREYSLFELDIICSRARIRFINEGLAIELQTTTSDSGELLQKGCKVLNKPSLQLTGLTRSAFGLIDNAVSYIEKTSGLLASGEDALKTQAVCETLSRQAAKLNKVKNQK